MFFVKMANLTIQIENRYDYVYNLCRNYLTSPTDCPDMKVAVSEEEIRQEIAVTTEFEPSADYAEGVCIYRAICKKLPEQFQAFFMHYAVIEYQGEGYAFAAHSGVGKSTHISLWRKKFGKEVHVINGDKPILRFDENRLWAYGTPWCGKEGWNTNASVPLKALCFLERAPENEIVQLPPKEAVMRVFHQVLPPSDISGVDALFPLLDRMLKEIPCYVLKCNISEEAAEVAYSGMNQK